VRVDTLYLCSRANSQSCMVLWNEILAAECILLVR
jgi:hypothetical protein